MKGHVQASKSKTSDAKSLLLAAKSLGWEGVKLVFDLERDSGDHGVLKMVGGLGPKPEVLEMRPAFRAVRASEGIPIPLPGVYIIGVKFRFTTQS